MKKTFLGLSLIAATVLVGTMSSVNVDAATKEETTVGIGFSDKGIGTGPFANGLNIAYYPKAFNFGTSNDFGGKEFTSEKAKVNYIGVFDDRSNEDVKGQGWKLEASLSPLTKVGDANAKLNGKLDLHFAEAQQVTMDPAKDMKIVNGASDWVLPTDFTEAGRLTAVADAAKYDFSKVGAGKSVELPATGQDPVTVMGAKDDASAARGLIIADAEKAVLTVTNQVAESQYSGKITWTLSNAYN